MNGSNSNHVAPNGTEDRLFELSQKRLEKFASLYPRILIKDDPETIHDVRVWSRRLQEILRILFPKPGNKKSRKLARMLRRTRRALGNCRNLDVLASLIQDKIAATGNPVSRDAWDHLRTYILEKRNPELRDARDKLSRYDLVDFVNRTQALLSSLKSSDDSQATLSTSVSKAWADWNETVELAKQQAEPEQIHGLRIAGKRLRYRVELLAELGNSDAKTRIKALKALQDQLGDWHDRQVLLETAGKFLMRANFLANHPDLGRALLVEMERERRRNDAALTNILKSAEKLREGWVVTEAKNEAPPQ